MTRLPSVASLFDSGLRVFGKEWQQLVSAVVLLSLPLYLLSLSLETNTALIAPYIILSILIGPLLSIITTTIVFFRYEKDRTIRSKGLYKYIHDRFFPVLWTSILASIIVLLSMVLLIIPLAVLGMVYLIAQPALVIGSTLSAFGVLSLIVLSISAIIISIGAGVYMMFAIPSAVLGKSSGLVAINKSIALVKGRWWNIFGRVLVLYIIGFFFTMIIAMFVLLFLGETGLGNLISTLLQQVVFLPITVAMVVFYLDVAKKHHEKKLRRKSSSISVTSVKKAPAKVSSAKKKSAKKTSKKSTKKSSKKVAKKSAKKSTKKKAAKKSSKKATKKTSKKTRKRK